MYRPAWLGLLLAVAVTAGCARAPMTPAKAPPPAPAASDINPQVTPPPGMIKVADNLAEVAAPAGFITQAEAKAAALAAMGRSGRYGTLTLVAVTFDADNLMWEADFATDGRVAAAPRSHPAPASSDPEAQHSYMTVTTDLLVAVDGKTGEIRGGGFRGGAPDPSRPDLEHYRGRILTGGEQVTLQLLRSDGGAEGRVLTVAIPEGALPEGLAFWQMAGGTGRIMEVWGLTSAPGAVTAYRVSMPDR